MIAPHISRYSLISIQEEKRNSNWLAIPSHAALPAPDRPVPFFPPAALLPPQSCPHVVRRTKWLADNAHQGICQLCDCSRARLSARQLRCFRTFLLGHDEAGRGVEVCPAPGSKNLDVDQSTNSSIPVDPKAGGSKDRRAQWALIYPHAGQVGAARAIW